MIVLYLILTQNKKEYIDTHNPIGVGVNFDFGI